MGGQDDDMEEIVAMEERRRGRSPPVERSKTFPM